MKCISLWQPWSSAIPLGLKRIETRGWATNFRGRFGIHASLRWTGAQKHFHAARREAGDCLPEELPLGAIVATAVLVRVVPVQALLDGGLNELERAYGDYGAGRFGWILEDVIALRNPIPFKGSQGFFNVPDELFTQGSMVPGSNVALTNERTTA